jgi:hypothetical protein
MLEDDQQYPGVICQVWVELRGSGQGRKTGRKCMSKREMRYTLAAPLVQTAPTSEATREEESSETSCPSLTQSG